MPPRVEPGWFNRLSVFLDFDGTISAVDITDLLCERFGSPSWRESDDRWKAGEIGSAQNLRELWAPISADTSDIDTVVRSVALDGHLPRLVHGLAERGAEVAIVSDGFGFYIPALCAGLPVKLFAAQLRDGRLVFPFAAPDCACAGCGTCKVQPIEQANDRGRVTVMVGDGASDRGAARAAEIVFARDDLARWCDTEGIDYTPFSSLGDVCEALGV